MWNKQHYIVSVDVLLEKLRQRCLGQKTPLTALLPKAVRQRSTKEQASFLSAELLFALMQVSPYRSMDAAMQRRVRQWLEALIRYLLEETNPCDQTFAQLIRLKDCDRSVRNLLFEKQLNTTHEVRTGEPPLPLEKLGIAIWHLLGAQKQQDIPREFYGHLCAVAGHRGIPDL